MTISCKGYKLWAHLVPKVGLTRGRSTRARLSERGAPPPVSFHSALPKVCISYRIGLTQLSERGAPTACPLQGIVLPRGSCARINRLLLPPPHPHSPHDCTTTARLLRNIRPPHRPLFCMPYTVQYWLWQYRVKANPQLKAFTRCCHYQSCMVYGITREGRAEVIYCAKVAQ